MCSTSPVLRILKRCSWVPELASDEALFFRKNAFSAKVIIRGNDLNPVKLPGDYPLFNVTRRVDHLHSHRHMHTQRTHTQQNLEPDGIHAWYIPVDAPCADCEVSRGDITQKTCYFTLCSCKCGAPTITSFINELQTSSKTSPKAPPGNRTDKVTPFNGDSHMRPRP